MGMVVSAPRLRIGQIVRHRAFGYRGVVAGVDLFYRGNESWYESVAHGRPARDRPWYTILVDRAPHQAYVAEQNLEPDSSGGRVEHPLLAELFLEDPEGGYRRIVN